MRKLLACVVVTLGLGSIASSFAAVTHDVEAEDYAVYSVILRSLTTRWLIRGETVDAAHSPEFDQAMAYLQKTLQRKQPPVALPEDLVSVFKLVYAKENKLDSKLLQVPNARIVPSSEIDKFFANVVSLEQAWSSFKSHFDGAVGIISLSRIAFSADQSTALASVSYACGGLCGSGSYVILEKIDGKWQIQTTVLAWLS